MVRTAPSTAAGDLAVRPPYARRRLVAAAALVAGIALGSFLYGAVHDSDEDRVRNAVGAFAAAIRAHNYDRVCNDLIAPDLRRRLEALGSCPAVIRRAAGSPSRLKASVTSVAIDGDQATAKVETRAGGETARGEVHLVKRGDRWLLATFQ